MRTRNHPLMCRGSIAALTLSFIFLPFGVAQSNNPKQQTIYLPDPTPRQLDPRLVFGDNSTGQARAEQLEAQQAAKRRQLVEWGANELVVLSQRLQANVAKRQPGSSMALNADDAGKIEELAKNLKAALKAQ